MAVPRTDEQSGVQPNPLDFIEQLFEANDWPIQRDANDQVRIACEINGVDLDGFFYWNEEEKILRFSVPLQVVLPKRLPEKLYELLYYLNEKSFLGAVSIAGEVLAYEYPLLIKDSEFTEGQLTSILSYAVQQSVILPPIFQLFFYGGKSPKDAIQYGCLEPVGEA